MFEVESVMKMSEADHTTNAQRKQIHTNSQELSNISSSEAANPTENDKYNSLRQKDPKLPTETAVESTTQRALSALNRVVSFFHPR